IGPAQAERRLTLTLACHAFGQQQPNRFLRQSPRHELEHERRWWIQPLHVVHRYEHTSLSGQLPKDAQARSRDRPLVRWRPLLLRQQERRLKCPPLDRGQRRERLGERRLEEIGQPRERETSLALGRSADKDPHTALARLLQPGPPHRRLADPCLTREDE